MPLAVRDIGRQPSSTLYVTTLMNGDDMIARAAARWSSACTCATASRCCSMKRRMTSAAMSLVAGRAWDGATNFRVVVGARNEPASGPGGRQDRQPLPHRSRHRRVQGVSAA
jgi:hypothetical protein